MNSLGIDGRGAREDSEAIADDVIERPDPIPLAEHFLRHQFRDAEGQLLLRRWQSDYYRFNGVCYEPVPAEAMTSRIYCHLEQCHAVRRNRQGVPMGGVVSVVPKKTMVQEVLGALPSRGLLVDGLEAPQWLIRGTNLPPAKELVACQNGLLHVPSGLLHLATPDFFTTNAVGFEYAADAPQPEKWLRFLRELWGDDQESIEALQMWFGHCLTADTTQQKIMLLVGPKRSGKGTIARVLTRLLGDSNVCSPSLAALAQNFGLSSLIGKLLATITDARLSHRTDHAVVAERLLSISGEDHVTIDRKFKEPVTVRLPTRFMILTNELPRLNDASGALAGRFVLLRLTRSFYGKENNRLTEELLTELPSILNWAVEGWRKLETRGHFDHPASSSEALRELEDLGSPMVAFVRDMCELGPQHEIEVDELFRAWKNWCEKQGREHTGTVQTFARDLRSVLPDLQCRQIRQEGRRIRLYSGITRIYEFPLLRRPLQGYPPAQQEVPQ